MSEETFDRGGRIPTFDGHIQNFPTWWKKFFAYAMMARIKSILKEESLYLFFELKTYLIAFSNIHFGQTIHKIKT